MGLLSNGDISRMTGFIDTIKDTRSNRTKSYPLNEILFVVLCGILSGQKSWYTITLYAQMNFAWFQKYYRFDNGIASHDTYNRVISLLDKAELERLLLDISCCFTLESGHRRVISFDGKAIARSASISDLQKKISDGGRMCDVTVNAFDHGLGICIGQNSSQIMGKEKQLARDLMERLALKDALITLDAGHASEETAAHIIDQGAAYILCIKDNNSASVAAIEEAFSQTESIISTHQTQEKQRGRKEVRTCCVINAIGKTAMTKKWRNIAQYIQLVRQRTVAGKTSVEKVYYISSSVMQAADYLHYIRQHWGIENKLHWVLDVIFREDASQARIGNAAANLATIRRIACSLLARDTKKSTNVAKILQFCLSGEYRDKILNI